MIEIISTQSPDAKIRLGEICEFEIIKSNPLIRIRSFLIHQNLFYLKPITDWSYESHLIVFPEAMGNYVLSVEWQHPFGKKGWVKYPFNVINEIDPVHYPYQTNTDPNTNLYAPSEWEAMQLAGYEKPVFDLLPLIVKSGWVVYDVGANLGTYSIQLSRLVGQEGWVYCIEASPVCVYFLRANLELNQRTNCQIFPIALTDGNKPLKFTINFSNSALGVTQSSHFYSSKIGQEIAVGGTSLDELINAYQLRAPNLVKIDVEGAEDAVIKGMRRTIQKYLPVILLEVHGRKAAEKTFNHMKYDKYCVQDIATQQKFSSSAKLLEWFPDSVRQILCTPE